MYHTDFAVNVKNVTKTFIQWQRDNTGKGLLRNLIKPEKLKITALDDISFSIGRGEFVAYAGPNGAGKSTTMKLLTGMLLPDSGDISVLSLSPQKQRKKLMQRLGILFGNRTELWWDHPVIQSFEWKKVVWGIPDDVYRRNLDMLTELLDIGKLLKTFARELDLSYDVLIRSERITFEYFPCFKHQVRFVEHFPLHLFTRGLSLPMITISPVSSFFRIASTAPTAAVEFPIITYFTSSTPLLEHDRPVGTAGHAPGRTFVRFYAKFTFLYSPVFRRIDSPIRAGQDTRIAPDAPVPVDHYDAVHFRQCTRNTAFDADRLIAVAARYRKTGL